MDKTTSIVIIVCVCVVAVCVAVVLATKVAGKNSLMKTIWGSTTYNTDTQNGGKGNFDTIAMEGGAGSSAWG